MFELLNTVITLMTDGLWIPVFVIIVAVLVWFIISSLRTDATKREETLMSFVNENKAESKEREHRLMEQLEQQTEAHTRVAATMERIEVRMQHIERAININVNVERGALNDEFNA